MNVIRRRGWEIPESCATPEHLFFDRRAFLAATGAGLAAPRFRGAAMAQRASDVPDPSAGLYPAQAKSKYVLDRDVTPRKVQSRYNNFYEYGTSKDVVKAAQQLRIRPWTVKIDGMVEKPRRSRSTICSRRCRSKSGSIAIAVSRRGAWRSRGRALRWRSS